MKSRMNAKGQIIIPKEILEHLNLQPGDEIAYEVRPGEGGVRLSKSLQAGSE